MFLSSPALEEKPARFLLICFGLFCLVGSEYYLPSSLFGYAYSGVVLYLLAVLQVALLAFLLTKSTKKRLYRPIGSAFLLLFLGIGFLKMLGMGGAISTGSCIPNNGDTPLLDTERCTGGSSAGWMNSQQYRFFATGKADATLCSTYAKLAPSVTKQPLPSDQRCLPHTPSNWSNITCPPGYAHCFACGRESVNGNNVFYQAIAFTPDCTRAMFVLSSDLNGKPLNTLFEP